MPVNPTPTPEQSPSVDNAEPISAPDEHMALDFDFYNSQFTDPGHYMLRLVVCSSVEDKDFTQIKVEKNNEGKFLQAHKIETDIVLQEEPMSDVKYEDHKWTFYLPKGNEICA